MSRQGDPPPVEWDRLPTLPGAKKLPAPVPASQREHVTSEPQPVTSESAPLTLADECLSASERGTVVTLCLDLEHAGSRLPELIGQFTRTGVYQRDGFGTAAIAIVVGRQLRRLIAEVTRPGRFHDRPTFDPEVGTAADITNPATLRWLGRLLDEARQLRLPVLVLLQPEIVPPVVDDDVRAELRRIAAPGTCIALLADRPGDAVVRLTPDGAPEPVKQSFVFVPQAPTEATKRKLMELPRSSFSPANLKRIDKWRAQAEGEVSR